MILTAINNLYLLSIYVKFMGLSIFIFVLRESGHVEGTLPSLPNCQYTCDVKKETLITREKCMYYPKNGKCNYICAFYDRYERFAALCLHQIFWRNLSLNRSSLKPPNRVPLHAREISNPYLLIRRTRECDQWATVSYVAHRRLAIQRNLNSLPLIK